MNTKKYFELMDVLNYGFDNEKRMIIRWNNGLLVRCSSITGEYETDTEPGDEEMCIRDRISMAASSSVSIRFASRISVTTP